MIGRWVARIVLVSVPLTLAWAGTLVDVRWDDSPALVPLGLTGVILLLMAGVAACGGFIIGVIWLADKAGWLG